MKGVQTFLSAPPDEKPDEKSGVERSGFTRLVITLAIMTPVFS